MGSKRALGDDIEQMADSVHTDKKRQASYEDLQAKIIAYLNKKDDAKERDLCKSVGCVCSIMETNRPCGTCRGCPTQL